MGWRDRVARWSRRRVLGASDVLARALPAWFRTILVSVPVVAAFLAVFFFLFEESGAHELAVLSFTSISLFTWGVVTGLSFGASPADGFLSLAACFVATGVVVALIYHRERDGVWRTLSLPSALRVSVFGLLAGLCLSGVKLIATGVIGVLGLGAVGVYLACLVPFFELWVASVFWLVIPILAIEDVSLTAALRRSRVLTRGSRAQICGILCVLSLLTIGIPVFHTGMGLVDLPSFPTMLTVLAVLTTTLQAAILAEGYKTLRDAKEGVPAVVVARVFD